MRIFQVAAVKVLEVLPRPAKTPTDCGQAELGVIIMVGSMEWHFIVVKQLTFRIYCLISPQHCLFLPLWPHRAPNHHWSVIHLVPIRSPDGKMKLLAQNILQSSARPVPGPYTSTSPFQIPAVILRYWLILCAHTRAAPDNYDYYAVNGPDSGCGTGRILGQRKTNIWPRFILLSLEPPVVIN